MNARVAKEEMALLLPGALNYSPASSDGARRAALARQAARSGGLSALLRRAVSAFESVRERRQVMAELSALSERELNDVGLTRSDLGRVFDPEFAAKLEAERALDVYSAPCRAA